MDLQIEYRPAKQNSVADALSHISPDTEATQDVKNETLESPLEPTPLTDVTVAALQMVSSDSEDSEWPKLQAALPHKWHGKYVSGSQQTMDSSEY